VSRFFYIFNVFYFYLNVFYICVVDGCVSSDASVRPTGSVSGAQRHMTTARLRPALNSVYTAPVITCPETNPDRYMPWRIGVYYTNAFLVAELLYRHISIMRH